MRIVPHARRRRVLEDGKGCGSRNVPHARRRRSSYALRDREVAERADQTRAQTRLARYL